MRTLKEAHVTGGVCSPPARPGTSLHRPHTQRLFPHSCSLSCSQDPRDDHGGRHRLQTACPPPRSAPDVAALGVAEEKVRPAPQQGCQPLGQAALWLCTA